MQVEQVNVEETGDGPLTEIGIFFQLHRFSILSNLATLLPPIEKIFVYLFISLFFEG